jgi:hypothetical protein
MLPPLPHRNADCPFFRVNRVSIPSMDDECDNQPCDCSDSDCDVLFYSLAVTLGVVALVVVFLQSKGCSFTGYGITLSIKRAVSRVTTGVHTSDGDNDARTPESQASRE